MADGHCESTVELPDTLLLSSVSSKTDFGTLATELVVEVDATF